MLIDWQPFTPHSPGSSSSELMGLKHNKSLAMVPRGSLPSCLNNTDAYGEGELVHALSQACLEANIHKQSSSSFSSRTV